MDIEAMKALAALNNKFYRENHESFSRSRQGSWPGWQRVLASLPAWGRSGRILDVACGNMRFERFMATSFPCADLSFTCIDSCTELAQDVESACFVQCDVVGALMDGRALLDESGAGFDVAVSFGFMHHIPGAELRLRFARELAAMVRPGGTIALSFWQFMDEPKLAARALRTTDEFQRAHSCALEPGDYVLGWDGRKGAYRYCHHFTEGEIDGMASRLADTCDAIDRFKADGRTGALNSYLVFRRL